MGKYKKPKPLKLKSGTLSTDKDCSLFGDFFNIEPEDAMKVARWFIEYFYWSMEKKHGKDWEMKYET